MHWIEDLSKEERIYLYHKYDSICKKIMKLMKVSFLVVLFSLYLLIFRNIIFVFIISFIFHGILGGYLITLGNTISAIRYNRVDLNNSYHKFGKYYGFYIIPIISHIFIREVLYIKR